MNIVILTGLSGAGKSVALNAFEDIGFFCVDNLPTSLIETFINLCSQTPSISRIALGIDIRERNFLNNLSDTISTLRDSEHKVEIIFLEANEEVLIRRFKETRRPHPLGYRDLRRALRRERNMMSAVRQEADRVIDTSDMNPHQLRESIIRLYGGEKAKRMSITLVSFGYKYGIPQEADLLFDVRFLPNPNFVEGLKELDGTTEEVKEFVLGQEQTRDFLKRLYPLLEFLIPLYRQEGRNYLTIGIGCTGGRHRSPAIVEELRKEFRKRKVDVSVIHRDIHGSSC